MKFEPRLTRPTAGNKYYMTKASGGYSDAIKGNPTDNQCDVLSNCVGYAYGRFNEIGNWGSCKYLYPVNAENFMQYKGACETGKTPRIGACMVWQKGATLSNSDGAGHVAIVEKVISDTEIVTSESGWGSSMPFYTKNRKKGSDGNWGQASTYKFLGFIYNPAPCCNESDASAGSSGTAGDSTGMSGTVIFKEGDMVKITGTKYYNGVGIPSWVVEKNWYVKSVSGTRVVIDKSEDGTHAICSAVNSADLQLIKASPGNNTTWIPTEGDLVKITGTKYYHGVTIPLWVIAKNWYVKSVSGTRVVIDKSEDGMHAICSAVNLADLQCVRRAK